MLLVVMRHVDDKRLMAIQMRRILADLPLAKDIIVTTPEEIENRGNLVGDLLKPALHEGVVVYESRQSAH